MKEEKKVNVYRQLNESFKERFVYHFGTGSGFYSEFNNMILCMMFCLKRKVQFQLYSQDAFFFEGMGWRKMFLPFCVEKKSRFHHHFNYREDFIFPSSGNTENRSKMKMKFAILSAYKIFTGNCLTSDVFYKCRTTWFEKETFTLPALGLENVSLRQAAQELVNIAYRFNAEYTAKIEKEIATLSLPDEFIGLHIRGGDKITERNLFPSHAYIQKAEQISSIRNAFILTDDYRLYENIVKKYPHWNFFTLTFPDERGYDNNQFSINTPERREKELLKVFASLEIMRRSELFIGTYSSNPGMFLGMCMPKEKVYGLDFPDWIIL